ncbi:UNVERIFIED_CONTAM: hypothetical protein FKN15_057555 [Acipenser sinensis]
MPNCYLYPGSPLQPPGDSGNGGWNTCPPKRAPANPSFFALWSYSDATRPIVPEDNTDLNGSTTEPQDGCRGDVRPETQTKTRKWRSKLRHCGAQ